jgi:hypothetical protein
MTAAPPLARYGAVSKGALRERLRYHRKATPPLGTQPRKVDEHAIEPIRWAVREFVPIHSLLGHTQRVPLARWALKG